MKFLVRTVPSLCMRDRSDTEEAYIRTQTGSEEV